MMSNGTTELELWNLLSMQNTASAIQFVGIAFLAWVGLRVSNNIGENPDSNIITKLIGTGFCVAVAWFMLFNFALLTWSMTGTASGFEEIAANGGALTDAARMFIDFAGTSEGFNIIPNPPQALLLITILAMQLVGIWKK